MKTAFAKAGRRLKARRADARLATRKTKRLNKEIKLLRLRLESLLKSHQEALEDLKGETNKTRAQELRAVIARQEAEIEKTIQQIDHKVGKRKSWKIKGRKARKRAAWWLRRRGEVGKKLRAAREKWAETHDSPVFETWMLNGCPGNVDEKLKSVIAFQVVVCNQYVTSTTTGGHTSTSLHFPWNNSDNEGHAVDTGASSVSSMQNAAIETRDHFGPSYFKELFSPCPWWLKYGAQYPGYFPAHGDHGHYGVY